MIVTKNLFRGRIHVKTVLLFNSLGSDPKCPFYSASLRKRHYTLYKKLRHKNDRIPSNTTPVNSVKILSTKFTDYNRQMVYFIVTKNDASWYDIKYFKHSICDNINNYCSHSLDGERLINIDDVIYTLTIHGCDFDHTEITIMISPFLSIEIPILICSRSDALKCFHPPLSER